MREITSAEQLHSLLHDRPAETETWKIGPDLSGSISDYVVQRTPTMRELTQEEVHELANYLNVTDEELCGPFFIDRSLICPKCGRHLTFLDFVQTVTESGLHERRMLADILCGRNGTWMTIAGKNTRRVVRCSNCQHEITYASHDYASSTYAYA